MKSLTILRHAKSSWDEPGLADFDRPLNDRGVQAAWRMGREFRLREMSWDYLVVSRAVRVRETLDHFAGGYGEDFIAGVDDRIYMASVETLLEIIRTFPEDSNAPFLVGHNPGLQQLVLNLSRADEQGLRDRVRVKFPTAALAVIELPLTNWKQLELSTGTIIELILPRELGD